MSHIKSSWRWWVTAILLLAGVVAGERWTSIRPAAAQDSRQDGRRTLTDLQDREARRRVMEELGRSGDERQVVPLSEALRGDRDFLVRSAAAEALGNLKSDLGAPALIAALDDVSPDVRAAAALALARLGQPQGILPLRRRLQDAEPVVRSAVAQALGKLGDRQALPELVKCLADTEPEVRTSAAEALGALGQSEAVEPLLRALGDDNLYVRSRAALALGTLGAPRAVLAVKELLLDKERTVRASAAEALGRFRDRQAVLPLLEVLRDREPVVRQNAAFALGKIGDETAAEGLMDALRDEDARVRARAVDALGALAVPHTLEAIVDTLRDGDPLVRTLSVQALGNFKDGRAVEALIQILAADDALLRRRAVESLAKIGDARAFPAVQTALGDTNPAVRASAVLALSRVGGNQALPALLTAFQSAETAVRNTAAFALARLGSEEAFVGVVEAVGQMDVEEGLNRRAAIVSFFNAVTESQPKLEKLLQSPNALRRRGVVLALMAVAVPPAATGTFLEVLADRDPQVRRAALAALAHTDPARFAQAAAQRLAAEPEPAVRVEWLSQLTRLRETPPALADTLRELARDDVAPEVRQAAIAALDRLQLPRVMLPTPPRMLPAIANGAPPPVSNPASLGMAPLPPAPLSSALVTLQPTVATSEAPSTPVGVTVSTTTPRPMPAAPGMTASTAFRGNAQPSLASPSSSQETSSPEPPTLSATATTLPTTPPASPTLTTPRTTYFTASEVPLTPAGARRLLRRQLPGAQTTPTWMSLGDGFTTESFGTEDWASRNEAQVIEYLERLVTMQLAFREAFGGRFATLAELQKHNGDLEAPFVDAGYAFTVYVTEATALGPADFFVLATPRIPGLTGKRAFYVDASGIIRSNEAGKQWLPAARQWMPIRGQSAG
ncbi:MAG: HEAT repeat domain-containing protein [Acidobacteriota bacterium]